MVVYKFEKFVEGIDGGMVPANLKELIKKASLKGRQTIVLDQSSVFPLFQDKSSLNYNGQPRIVKKKIENFVEKIISCEVNLIVCLRGSCDKNLYESFSKSKLKFDKQRSVVQSILGKENEELSFRPQSDFCSVTTFASIPNECYEVFTSLTRTHAEVAEIAIKKKCLAVIGQDSNYLIYNGIPNYISSKSLNIETFDCFIYDKERILNYLGLNSYLLPMFATLCGNDIIHSSHLRQFHVRILKHCTTKRRPSIHLSVANELRRRCNEDLYQDVQYFVKLIGNSKINESLIRKSLDMYLKFKENQSGNKLLKFVADRASTCDWSLILYKVVTKKIFQSKIFTGIADENLTVANLLRPLRRKIYGILYPAEISVEEYFMEEMLEIDQQKPVPYVVNPIIPNYDNPGVIKLFSDRSPEMNILRWNLFLSCINERLNFSAVRMVPEKLLFPVLALRYLAVEVGSYSREPVQVFSECKLKGFLIAALIVAAFPEKRLEDVPDSKPDLWTHQLTILYVEACYMLSLLNEVCGFVIPKSEACVCNFYDGKLTHYICSEMGKGAECDEFFEGNPSLEALFYTLWDVIFVGL